MFVLENLGVFKKISGQLHPVCGNQISYFKTKHFFSNPIQVFFVHKPNQTTSTAFPLH